MSNRGKKPTIFFISKYTVSGVDNYTTIEHCVNYLKDQRVIGIDIETCRYNPNDYDESIYKGGLDPYLSKIIMLQLGTLENLYVIDVRDFSKEELQPIIDLLHWNQKITFVGHNLKFEGKHLKHKYNISLKKVWDTMICEMNLKNGLEIRYSLAHLAERYLKVKMSKSLNLFTVKDTEEENVIDKSTRLEFINIGNNKFNKTQILYGADDILYPLLIRVEQMKGRYLRGGELYNPTVCHRIENSFTQVLADIELNGLGFDKELWNSIYESKLVDYNKRKEDLDKIVIDNFPNFCTPLDLFGEQFCRIEWTSSKQVVEFFKYLGFCPQEVSKSTQKLEYTVGAATLLKLLPNKYKGNYMKDKWVDFETNEGKYIYDKDTLILNYLLFKRSEQAVTTFGKDWLKYVHPVTGRVHSSYKQILNTGRMSSTNPNLQNLPTGEYRKCFIPTKGNYMLNADYSSQEIRIVADITNDENFVQFFVKGDDVFYDDFHSFSATKIYRILDNDESLLIPPKELPGGEHNPEFNDDHNEKRTNSKGSSFKIFYGGSAFTLKDQLGISLEEAETFINAYFEAFPTLSDNFKEARKNAVDMGYVLINKESDRRWFCPFHRTLENLKDNIDSYFPYEYFEEKTTYQKKKSIYQSVINEYPKVTELNKTYSRLKGKLERAGLNYRIQGCLTERSRVLTQSGWIQLKDFEVGNVWTGEKWATARKIHRGKAPIIHLQLSDGRIFECDNRHKLLIKVNNIYSEWSDVNDIIGKELVVDGGYTTDWGQEIGSIEEYYTLGNSIDREGDQLNWNKIFTLNRERRLAFFKGWYNRYGVKCSTNEGVIIDDISYKKLICNDIESARVFLQLCQTLEIRGYIKNHKDHDGPYTVYLQKEKKSVIVESIKYLDKIEDTYTLSVDDERHSFSNEGFISKNTAAMMMKYALCALRNKLINEDIKDFIITNVVHDEVVAESSEANKDKYSELLSEIMVEAGGFFCKNVPMKATCIPNTYWTH